MRNPAEPSLPSGHFWPTWNAKRERSLLPIRGLFALILPPPWRAKALVHTGTLILTASTFCEFVGIPSERLSLWGNERRYPNLVCH
jgi:hypothetical protein